MSDETPEIEPEEPEARRRRLRLRRRSKEEQSASETTEIASPSQATRSESEAAPVPEATRVASDADATPDEPVDAEPPTGTEPAEPDSSAEAEEVVALQFDAQPPETETAAQAEPDLESEAAVQSEPVVRSEPEKRRGVPSRPAPSRRRAQREPGAPLPVVRAQAKYVHSSPRKARLVCDHIRGKTVEEARAILAHTPRDVARDWSKLLESAVANAEHNHELVGEDLYVEAVTANDGPTIKRFRPRAMGRATPIRKRTSHLMISLTPKE